MEAATIIVPPLMVGIVIMVLTWFVLSKFRGRGKFIEQRKELELQKKIQLVQAQLLQAYLEDTSELKFAGLTADEAIAAGQEILWDETIKFNTAFTDCLENGIVLKNDAFLKSCIRILKAVHTMRLIDAGRVR